MIEYGSYIFPTLYIEISLNENPLHFSPLSFPEKRERCNPSGRMCNAIVRLGLQLRLLQIHVG